MAKEELEYLYIVSAGRAASARVRGSSITRLGWRWMTLRIRWFHPPAMCTWWTAGNHRVREVRAEDGEFLLALGFGRRGCR